MYEAPHRIAQTLVDVQAELGERRVAIGRELTKIHEYLAIRPISDWLTDPPPPQGELVLLIFPPELPTPRQATAIDAAVLADAFWQTTNDATISRREALKSVARKYGVSTRDVFAAVEADQKKG
jgi:16S rRNA (cytidine1402-2'-O)-methyltransferase